MSWLRGGAALQPKIPKLPQSNLRDKTLTKTRLSLIHCLKVTWYIRRALKQLTCALWSSPLWGKLKSSASHLWVKEIRLDCNFFFFFNLLSCFGLVVSTTPVTKKGTEIKVKIAARQMRLTFPWVYSCYFWGLASSLKNCNSPSTVRGGNCTWSPFMVKK